MKCTISKESLLKTAQIVQNAINPKTNLPILSNILIDAEQDQIVFTATDLDIGIITELPLKPSILGSITIPAKKFLDVIKELPNNDISLSVKKNNIVNIDCNTTSLKIMGLSKDEFPQLPQFKDKDFVIIPQKQLKLILSMTSFAMSNDETRYVLNGVLFIIKPSLLRLVATDGRRLAIASSPMQFPKIRESEMIIPIKAIRELERMLTDEGEIKIFFGKNQVSFDFGSTKILSRIIEGEFPKYEPVVPKELKDKVSVPREAFLSAMKRANLFTSQDSMAVKVDLSRDLMVVSKSASYIGEMREELPVEYKGKELSIGFNPVYLIDVLKVVTGDTVSFEVSDPDKPAVFRLGGDYTYVVLPMQL